MLLGVKKGMLATRLSVTNESMGFLKKIIQNHPLGWRFKCKNCLNLGVFSTQKVESKKVIIKPSEIVFNQLCKLISVGEAAFWQQRMELVSSVEFLCSQPRPRPSDCAVHSFNLAELSLRRVRADQNS